MLLDLVTAQVITLYFFLAIIGLAFVLLAFTGESLDRRYQKVIGGLSAFCIAIIAHHPGIYVVSLFIGGLIIASEEFMKFLVAIIKSDSQELYKTITAMQPQIPSPAELVEEEQEKAEEVQKQTQLICESSSAENQRSSMTSFMKTAKVSEEQILKWYEDHYQTRFRRNIKMSNVNGHAIFDGAILTENGDVREAIEIKFLRTTGGIPSYMRIRQFLERYSFLNLITLIKLIIVIDDASNEQIDTLNSDIKRKFDHRKEFSFVVLTTQNGTVDLTPLEEES